MMAEEAIAVLQESIQQNKAMKESPNTFFSSADIVGGAVIKAGRRIDALEMAIAALRAQQTPAKLDRSRWEGCWLCRGATALSGSVFIHKDEDPVSSDGFTFGTMGFCPVCGKTQTEEAWAELEKKLEV